MTLNIDTVRHQVIADTSVPVRVGGSGGVDHIIGTQSGLQLKSVRASSGPLSGANYTFANLIPAGSFVYSVRAKVTTLVTGATSILVGVSGNTDKFADAMAVTLGAKSNSVINGDNTTVNVELFKTATGVLLTAGGSNFTAGEVEVEVIYATVPAIE
jgi:hypothetical protein